MVDTTKLYTWNYQNMYENTSYKIPFDYVFSSYIHKEHEVCKTIYIVW